MSVAQQDTEFMIDAKEKAKSCYARKLQILFQELDASGDGLVSWEEFAVLLTDDRLRSFLSAMEIDASDLQGLFEVLGDGSGNLSAEDFMVGANRIHGAAKAVDMAQLLSIVKRLESKLESSATSCQQLVLQADLVVATGRSSGSSRSTSKNSNKSRNKSNSNNNNNYNKYNNRADPESYNTPALIAEGDELDHLSLPFRSEGSVCPLA
ncbi:unnamed protein product [Polarella glacialis]|uniref:EF-hand domain-containing protein n=1 Tax=Polarella glacialis TaxID=89957 RepID=A0A813JR16_POLGL|nr:unnamed protein product [Polarella glacialis]